MLAVAGGPIVPVLPLTDATRVRAEEAAAAADGTRVEAVGTLAGGAPVEGIDRSGYSPEPQAAATVESTT